MGLLTLTSSLTRILVRKLASDILQFPSLYVFKQAAADGLNPHAASLPALSTPSRRSSTVNFQRAITCRSISNMHSTRYIISSWRQSYTKKIWHIYNLKWQDQRESNPHLVVRSHIFYPLDYGPIKLVDPAGLEPATQ